MANAQNETIQQIERKTVTATIITVESFQSFPFPSVDPFSNSPLPFSVVKISKLGTSVVIVIMDKSIEDHLRPK